MSIEEQLTLTELNMIEAQESGRYDKSWQYMRQAIDLLREFDRLNK